MGTIYYQFLGKIYNSIKDEEWGNDIELIELIVLALIDFGYAKYESRE